MFPYGANRNKPHGHRAVSWSGTNTRLTSYLCSYKDSSISQLLGQIKIKLVAKYKAATINTEKN